MASPTTRAACAIGWTAWGSNAAPCRVCCLAPMTSRCSEPVGSRSGSSLHLDRVAGLAGILGARACVFGAPAQRDPGEIGADEAWHRALGGMRRIAPAFAAVDSAIAFEAVPARYGCRFVTSTAEAVRFVSEAAAPGIGLLIDTGMMFVGQEDPAVLLDAAPLAVHMHISEPDMAPLGQGDFDHMAIAAALLKGGYEGPISIEMQPVPAWDAAITHAVAMVRDVYL